MAKGLGWTLMPWQQEVFDVALEYDPDSLELAYREVFITVPRQSGKTTMALVATIHRLTLMAQRMVSVLLDMGRPELTQVAYYTAQTGREARKKMLEVWLPIIGRSDWRDLLVDVKRGVGNESFMFSDKEPLELDYGFRGTMEPLPGGDSSGHGFTSDFGLLDEVWSDADDRREQALVPGQNTRPSPQVWIISTMGTDESVYMNRKVAQGRVAVERGVTDTACYFEWSGTTDDDPADEERWYEFHPALGITTPVEAVRAALASMEEKEFRRAYMNVVVPSNDKLIPMDRWLRCESPSVEIGDPTMYAVDANPLRTNAAIAVSDGTNVELVSCYEDLDRAVGDLVRAASGEMGRPGPVAIDKQSPIASKVNTLEQAGVRVMLLDYEAVKTGCAEMYDAILGAKVQVRPADELSLSVEGAKRKMVGDRFVWSRKSPSTDLTPLNAVTFARHAALTAPTVWRWLMN